jgi:hypothetical protein
MPWVLGEMISIPRKKGIMSKLGDNNVLNEAVVKYPHEL